MAVGNMQYGTINHAGRDSTSLTATADPETLGVENGAPGKAAIMGRARREGHGVYGISNGVIMPGPGEGQQGLPAYDGAGVCGENTATGEGVRGLAPGGTGVAGYTHGAGPGVHGRSTTGSGVSGLSRDRHGVEGASSGKLASGVYGENRSREAFGVWGRSDVPSIFAGIPYPFGAGVFGQNNAGGYGGIFVGDVFVTGTLFKAYALFAIDHPVDPANKLLYHSGVESPDMLNVYSGNATTDDDGHADVELPAYFEALNRDFRYQLTVIGQFAQAMVAEPVRDNRFVIQTDKPSVTVSWQVIGVRRDAWANAHRSEVEVEKPEDQRGKYLTPVEHGQPPTEGIFYIEPPEPEETRIYTDLEQDNE